MARISEQMASGIKDTISVIISEGTGADQKQVREWLNTVNTAEDFFGSNKQGLAEYNNFIRQKEQEYNRAVRNSKKKIS